MSELCYMTLFIIHRTREIITIWCVVFVAVTAIVFTSLSFKKYKQVNLPKSNKRLRKKQIRGKAIILHSIGIIWLAPVQYKEKLFIGLKSRSKLVINHNTSTKGRKLIVHITYKINCCINCVPAFYCTDNERLGKPLMTLDNKWYYKRLLCLL